MHRFDPHLMIMTCTALVGLSSLLAVLYAPVAARRGRVVGLSGTMLAKRQAAREQSIFFRVGLPWFHTLGALPRRWGGTLQSYLAEPYEKAGSPGGLTRQELVGVAVMLGLVLSAVLALGLGALDPVFAPLGLLGLVAGLLAVVTHLQARAEVRELRIERMLPSALDLLVLCMRSGISLNLALRQVVADHRDHPLGEELGRVLAEIDLGLARPEAFRGLAVRVPTDDMRSLADTIIQAEELGWPLADTLSQMADRLTSERALRAQAKAGAAGVAVMLPSTLVMVAALLLLFGPFIVRYLQGGFAID